MARYGLQSDPGARFSKPAPGRRGTGHAKANGTVVVAPMQIDRWRTQRAAGEPPIAVHIGRENRHHMRQIGLLACDEPAKQIGGLAVGVGEDVAPSFLVHHRLVNVHG
jgi:hypothetical protein